MGSFLNRLSMANCTGSSLCKKIVLLLLVFLISALSFGAWIFSKNQEITYSTSLDKAQIASYKKVFNSNIEAVMSVEKARGEQLYSRAVAESIYRANMAYRIGYYLKANYRNENAVKTSVMRTLKLMQDSSGAFFILKKNGEIVLDATNFISNGKEPLKSRDINGKLYIKEMVDAALKKSKKATTFSLEDAEGGSLKSVLYARYLDSFNWIVGAKININSYSFNVGGSELYNRAVEYQKSHSSFSVIKSDEISSFKEMGLSYNELERLREDGEIFIHKANDNYMQYFKDYGTFTVSQKIKLPKVSVAVESNFITLDDVAIIVAFFTLFILLSSFIIYGDYMRERGKIELSSEKKILELEEKIRFYNRVNQDAQTGLVTRDGLFEVFSHINARRMRIGFDVSFIELSVDNSDLLKDRVGKEKFFILRDQVINLVRTRVRASDTFALLDENSFLILLENATLDQARRMAEILRKLVKEFDFPAYGYHTCSFGVTMIHSEDNITIEEPLGWAKEAQVSASRDGGDKIVIKYGE